MKNAIEIIRKNKYILIYIVLLCCISVSLALNDSVWLDEAYSMNWVAKSWIDMMIRLAADVHPPLFYMLLKVTLIFTPRNLFVAKAFIIVGLLLTLSVGAIALKKRFGIGTVFVYTLFIYSIPMLLIKSVEIRMYTWGMAFTVLSAVYMYKLMEQEDKKRSDWICWVVFSLCAAYTHYYALLCMVFLYPLLLIFILTQKDYKAAKNWLIASVATVIGYMPWFPIALNQIKAVNGEYWIEEETLIGHLKNVFRHDAFPHSTKIYLLLLLCSTLWMLYKYIKEKNAKHYWGLSCMVPFWGIIMFGLAYARIERPIMVERYLLFAIALLAIGLAVGMSEWKWPIAAVACAFFALMIFVNYPLAYDREYNTHTDETLAFIEENGYQDELIMTDEGCMISVMEYYYPACNTEYYPEEFFVPDGYEKVIILDTKDSVDVNSKELTDYDVEVYSGYGLDNTLFDIKVLTKK